MRSERKSQNWLSGADDDVSALMFCSPWVTVGADSGRLLFSEEPAEYYSLKHMEHNPQDSGDDKADLPAENVVKTNYGVASLLMEQMAACWDLLHPRGQPMLVARFVTRFFSPAYRETAGLHNEYSVLCMSVIGHENTNTLLCMSVIGSPFVSHCLLMQP
jgi:hypothetical protein